MIEIILWNIFIYDRLQMYEFWNSLVLYVDNIFWFGLINSELILIIIIILFFVLIFGTIFVKLLKLKLLKHKQKLVYEYDNILYIVSSYNYQTWTYDSLEIIHKILESKNPAYMPNNNFIFDSIQKIETEFWKKIIPNENFLKIKKLIKKIKFCFFLAKLLKFIIILSIILFVAWIIYLNY